MLRFVPKIYQFFLASNVIVPFLVSSAFFVGFLMTFEMFRIMKLMTSDEVTIGFIMSLMGNVAITLVPMAMPLAVFFSIIFCLGKMSGDSEYVALRAAGLTKFKIMVPFLLVGFLVSVNVYYLSQELVPAAHAKVRKKIKILSSTSLIQGIKSGQFFTAIPNVTIFPAQMNEKNLELKDVFLHMYDPGKILDKVIWAKDGKILHSKNEATGIETFKLLLKNGNITSFQTGVSDLEKILFEEYVLPISEQRFSYATTTKEVMMDRKQLADFVAGGVEKAKKLGYKERHYINARYEYWNRINTPILCFLLSFLGFSLGVTGTRGKGKGSTGKAILFLIGYYVVYFSFVNLARGMTVPAWSAVVFPSALLLACGIYFYRKLDWVS